MLKIHINPKLLLMSKKHLSVNCGWKNETDEICQRITKEKERNNWYLKGGRKIISLKTAEKKTEKKVYRKNNRGYIERKIYE